MRILLFLSKDKDNEEAYYLQRVADALEMNEATAYTNLSKLVEAEWLLGRPYSIVKAVTEGRGAGKRIGYPTANLDVWPETPGGHPGVLILTSFTIIHVWTTCSTGLATIILT